MPFSKWEKFAVQFLFIIAFIVLTTYALLKAYGYQYDLIRRDFRKTSIIDIATPLKEVSLYLDDKLVATSTPYRVLELHPGMYKVRLEKKGYLSWDASIIVEPERVYKFDGIVLIPERFGEVIELVSDSSAEWQHFLEEPLLKDLEVPSSKTSFLSLDGKKLYYEDQGSFFVYDFETKKKLFVTRLSGQIRDIRWFQDGKDLFFRMNDMLYFCDVEFLNCYELLKLEEGDAYFVFGGEVVFLRGGKWYRWKPS